MKTALLVMGEQRVILDRLYERVESAAQDCTIFRLTKHQQLNLGRFLSEIDHGQFDRVVIFSRLKRLAGQVPVLKCIPGLVFLEHDAYQNYMPGSKYFGAYSRLYKQLPHCRVLVSGALVAQRMRDEGIDAVFVSKGYDETMLRNLGVDRDIELGFLGSLKSNEYQARKSMLTSLSGETGLLVARTASGDEYLQMLNRIKIFVSADIGMGEFMIKNFEAMACGCVLLAWSQGEEDALLGFEEGSNVLFYRSRREAIEQIEALRADPAWAQRLAEAGQRFVEKHYTFERVGDDLARHIERPMRRWQLPSLPSQVWARLRHGMRVSPPQMMVGA